MLQRDFHQKGSSTAHGSARQILLHLIWCTPDLNSPLSTSASDRHSCSLGNFELDVAHVMDTSWELAKEATLNPSFSGFNNQTWTSVDASGEKSCMESVGRRERGYLSNIED